MRPFKSSQSDFITIIRVAYFHSLWLSFHLAYPISAQYFGHVTTDQLSINRCSVFWSRDRSSANQSSVPVSIIFVGHKLASLPGVAGVDTVPVARLSSPLIVTVAHDFQHVLLKVLVYLVLSWHEEGDE